MKNVQQTINTAVLNNPTWSKNDRKTLWIIRANDLGISGYSALLKDSF